MDLKRLIPLYLGAAIGPMGGIGIVTVIPVLAKLWGIEFGTASLAISFYMIPFVVMQLFSGAIAQLFDARRALLFGFTVYTLGSVLCGLSPELWALLGSRVIQGVGAAFLTPIIMALIGELVPKAHLGKAMGMLGVAYTTGVTLGPLISGIIEVRWGWPGFFFFLGGLAVCAGTVYGFTSRAVTPEQGEYTKLLSIFPMLKRALLEPGVLLLSLAAYSFFIAYIGIMTFTADHLKVNLHLASDQIGTIISVTGFSGIVVSPIAGFLGDRLGRRNVFMGGAMLTIACIGLMVTLKYQYGLYIGLFLLFGTGAATAWTSINTMAVEISPAMRKPVTSVYNAIKFSGYACSPIILALLYEPLRLPAVQLACMVAVLLSALFTALAVHASGRA